MHPSTALATVLVDELLRGGVTDAVLAPGSRSAPLAYALARADQQGRLRLHVRIDERSAAFLALGLARASGRPVPVATTSGTAVANLHPAVLEAHHAGIPLLVLSADRPAELRGTGANQTTVQPGIFAGALRWEADLPAPEVVRDAAGRYWRGTVCRALAAARGSTGAHDERVGAGPVHLNVSFRDPLAPDLADVEDLPTTLAGRPGGRPWTQVASPEPSTSDGARPEVGAPTMTPAPRTLMLLGDLPGTGLTRRALDFARAAGWPVLAEPFGLLTSRAADPHVVPHGVLVAGQVASGRHQHLLPDRVVVVGRLTLFREFGSLVRRPGVSVEHVTASLGWTDPSHVVQRVHGTGALSRPPEPEPGTQAWVRAWVQAGADLSPQVRRLSEEPEALTGVAVAGAVATCLGSDDLLVLGSSNAPRDLAIGLGHDDAPGQVPAARVLANRGLAGIDGTVSTAVGAALTGTRTVALMGDLTFLHDAGGLVIGPAEPVPDLSIVVVNDDGGGIFSTLEYGDPTRSATPELAAVTERVFGTPHGTDLGALCAAHRVGHQRVTSVEELREALGQACRGIRVIEVPVARATHRQVRDALA